MRNDIPPVHGPHAVAPSDDAASFLEKLCRAALDGTPTSAEDALRLTELHGPDVDLLFAWADRIRETFRGNQIHLCSIINVTSNISLARAYQSAEASWLAPFDYSYIVFATFWGYVFWAHVPDALTVLGMALIAGAGGYVAWRERQLNRAQN